MASAFCEIDFKEVGYTRICIYERHVGDMQYAAHNAAPQKHLCGECDAMYIRAMIVRSPHHCAEAIFE